jgi:hypothetical protein
LTTSENLDLAMHRSALARRAAAVLAAVAAGPVQASLFAGEALDTAADIVSWVVLIFVPIIVIVVFWLVHVLPEKIAHNRHHPQTKAIQTLCLLSLVFGGLLWPLAWLWAYTKPVAYKVAYGTDVGDEYFDEAGAKARAGELDEEGLQRLKDELDAMSARAPLPPKLARLREDIAALEATAPPVLTDEPEGPAASVESITRARSA